MAGIFQSNIGDQVVGEETVRAETSGLEMFSNAATSLLGAAGTVVEGIKQGKKGKIKDQLDVLSQQRDAGDISNTEYTRKAKQLYTNYRSENTIEDVAEIQPVFAEYGVTSFELINKQDLADAGMQAYYQTEQGMTDLSVMTARHTDPKTQGVDSVALDLALRENYATMQATKARASAIAKDTVTLEERKAVLVNDVKLLEDWNRDSSAELTAILSTQLDFASGTYNNLNEYANFSSEAQLAIQQLKQLNLSKFRETTQIFNFSEEEFDKLFPVWKETASTFDRQWEIIKKQSDNFEQASNLILQQAGLAQFGAIAGGKEYLDIATETWAMMNRDDIVKNIRMTQQQMQVAGTTINNFGIGTETGDINPVFTPNGNVPKFNSASVYTQEELAAVSNMDVNEIAQVAAKVTSTSLKALETEGTALAVATQMNAVFASVYGSGLVMDANTIKTFSKPAMWDKLQGSLPVESYEKLKLGHQQALEKSFTVSYNQAQQAVDSEFGEGAVKVVVTKEGRVTYEVADMQALKASSKIQSSLGLLGVDNDRLAPMADLLADYSDRFTNLSPKGQAAYDKLAAGNIKGMDARDTLIDLFDEAQLTREDRDVINALRSFIRDDANYGAGTATDAQIEGALTTTISNLFNDGLKDEITSMNQTTRTMRNVHGDDFEAFLTEIRTGTGSLTEEELIAAQALEAINTPEETRPEIPEGAVVNQFSTTETQTDETGNVFRKAEGSEFLVSDSPIKTQNSEFTFNLEDNPVDIATSMAGAFIADTGATEAAAAAVFGNSLKETDNFKAIQEYKPAVKGSKGGLGLIQWTGVRRREFEAWLQENGKNAANPLHNYEYLLFEMKNGNHWSGGGSYEEFIKIKDPREAAIYFETKYLRPDPKTSDTAKRISDSRAIFREL